MLQPVPGLPAESTSAEAEEARPSNTPRRRRGRRGGRGRRSKSSQHATDVAMGAMNPPEPPWAGDEQEVSQQLRMLMTPRGPDHAASETAAVTRDPQLTYTPPAKIESHDPKPEREPVSAKSFKKSESPIQALMATVGSMAILAGIYHFGVWEGSQVQLDAPTEYASVATPPTMSIAPDPMQYQPDAVPAVGDGGAPNADYVPPTVEATPPALMTPPPVEVAPEPVEATAVEPVVAAPKPTPIPVPTSDPAPSGLYLQVGALKDAGAARGLESRLSTAGFSVEVLEQSGDGLIRVISGPYKEMPEARTVAQELSSLGIKSFPKRF